jgi:cell division protein FtsL
LAVVAAIAILLLVPMINCAVVVIFTTERDQDPMQSTSGMIAVGEALVGES